MNAHARLVRRIEQEMERRGWPAVKVAEAIRMSPSWVSELRDGGVGKTLQRLDQIAEGLGLDVGDLFSPIPVDASENPAAPLKDSDTLPTYNAEVGFPSRQESEARLLGNISRSSIGVLYKLVGFIDRHPEHEQEFFAALDEWCQRKEGELTSPKSPRHSEGR